MVEKHEILKVLVGSRAHGLSTPDSDFDYRGVFVVPTDEILKLGGNTKATHWSEGKDDDTAYEISHFLHLATKSNPSILEVFVGPVIETTKWGDKLRDLFPYIYDTRRVVDAFVGYSRNQQKKMLDDKYESAGRKWKYAVAYLRTLIMARQLIITDTMTLKVPLIWMKNLEEIRDGMWSIGRIMDMALALKVGVYAAYEECVDEGRTRKPDMEKINEFLLELRHDFWPGIPRDYACSTDSECEE